jgi:hypothetical protein
VPLLTPLKCGHPQPPISEVARAHFLLQLLFFIIVYILFTSNHSVLSYLVLSYLVAVLAPPQKQVCILR